MSNASSWILKRCKYNLTSLISIFFNWREYNHIYKQQEYEHCMLLHLICDTYHFFQFTVLYKTQQQNGQKHCFHDLILLTPWALEATSLNVPPGQAATLVDIWVACTKIYLEHRYNIIRYWKTAYAYSVVFSTMCS